MYNYNYTHIYIYRSINIIQYPQIDVFPMYIPTILSGRGSLFTVELFLRIAAVGPRGYFCAAHTAWNWFDTMIVISALRLGCLGCLGCLGWLGLEDIFGSLLSQ